MTADLGCSAGAALKSMDKKGQPASCHLFTKSSRHLQETNQTDRFSETLEAVLRVRISYIPATEVMRRRR